MGDILNIIELDCFVRQQPQRPPGKTFWRTTAAQCNQMRLKIPVCFFDVNTISFPLLKGKIKPFFDEPFLDPVNFSHAYVQDAGNLFVG